MNEKLTHLDADGRAAMVDVGAKAETKRRAVATGFVALLPETVSAIRMQSTPKGNVLQTARLAGIMAAKRTSELIPLCHQLNLTHVDVRAELRADGVYLEAEASVKGQTGVEMEALTAVSVAALTIYDMCKALDKDMTISGIRLEEKTGGKSGTYRRAE